MTIRRSDPYWDQAGRSWRGYRVPRPRAIHAPVGTAPVPGTPPTACGRCGYHVCAPTCETESLGQFAPPSAATGHMIWPADSPKEGSSQWAYRMMLSYRGVVVGSPTTAYRWSPERKRFECGSPRNADSPDAKWNKAAMFNCKHRVEVDMQLPCAKCYASLNVMGSTYKVLSGYVPAPAQDDEPEHDSECECACSRGSRRATCGSSSRSGARDDR